MKSPKQSRWRRVAVLVAVVSVAGFVAIAVSGTWHSRLRPLAAVATADAEPAPVVVIGRRPPHEVEVFSRLALGVVGFASSEPGRQVDFECRLDEAVWRGCSSPWRRRVGAGRHRLQVRVAAGTPPGDPVAASARWRVRRWRPDLVAARRFAATRDGRVSFAIDTGSGPRSFRGALTAPMASTAKVMLMVAYLRRPELRGRPLSGSERDLLTAMITTSDNDAADVVSGVVGSDAIEDVAGLVGMPSVSCDGYGWGLCRTDARDQAKLMRRLERYLPERHRRFALSQLASIVSWQRWGIAEVPLGDWRLRFKGGWGISDEGEQGAYGTVHHQVIQLSNGRRRIGLAILTQDNLSDTYGRETLEGVASRLLGGLPGVVL